MVSYYKKGDPESAITYYKKALEVDPEYEKARRNLKTVTDQLEKSYGHKKWYSSEKPGHRSAGKGRRYIHGA